LKRVNCEIRECVHFIGIKKGKLICRAFPEEIPNEIVYGTNKHINPYKGDHGIQFGTKKNAM